MTRKTVESRRSTPAAAAASEPRAAPAAKTPAGPRRGAPPRPGTHAARRGLVLDARIAAGILALLVIAFFHSVALEGMTFVSPDTVAPAGFVSVGEKALYQDHVYPLWNPYVFLGMPSFASGAYNPLIYPPDWPLALLNRVVPLPDMSWMLLYYFLGAFFMYLLAREWGARPEGAVLAGAAFVFAPNLVAVGSHGHGSQLVNSAYIPLLLWLAARWMRRGGLHHLGWLALAGGFQMLRGHAQIAFYTWFAIAIYLVVDVTWGLARRAPEGPPIGTRIARAAGIGAAMVLAFGLAGFYNLPLRDYARHSIRGGGEGGGVGMDYATAWSLAPLELLTAVVPGLMGFGGETYWGGMPFTDYPNAYVGMVAVVVALPAVLANGAPRIFALVLAVVAVLIAFGKNFPLYGFLYDHLPLFNKFRIPVMVMVLFQVAVALALAWGWSRTLEEAETRKERGGPVGKLMLGAAIVLALALVVGVMGQEAWREAYLRAASAGIRGGVGVMMAGETAQQALRACVTSLGRVVLLGLIATGMVLVVRRRMVPARLGSLGILALLLIELWPVSGQVMAPVIGPRTMVDPERGRDDVVEALQRSGPPGSFRVLPLDPQDFRSNRFAGFGIASVGGYHAAKPKLAQDYIGSGYVDNLYWMRLLNVRYLTVGSILDTPGLREVFRGQRQIVYENTHALPRATLVGSYRVAPVDTAILDSIGRGVTDPAQVTWLTQDPRLTLGPVEGARARIARYDLNRVEVEVETPGPGLLRLADLWYPDWKATVDGRPAEVLRADYLLRVVAVPAGRHHVVFAFRSASVTRGLALTLASFAAILLLLLAGWWQARRRQPALEPGRETG
jgi:hypothetical protein